MSVLFRLFVLFLSLQASIAAQESSESSQATSSQETLNSLHSRLEAKALELKSLREELWKAKGTATEKGLNQQVEKLLAEQEDLALKFESIATGISSTEFDDVGEEDFNLNQEVVALLEPFIKQLKEVTEEPRKIEQLRTQAAAYMEKHSLATNAIKKLRELLSKSTSESERLRISTLLKQWEGRQADFKSKEDVALYELQTKLLDRKSLLDSTGSVFNGFFRTRGVNLLIAIAAFLSVFLFLKFLRRRFLKVIFRKGANFYSRLTSVSLQLLSFLCALGVMILTLFSVSDWALLVFVLIFLLGIAWASVNMLPQFVEQVNLLLNLGAVREGERIIVAGLPWRVDELKLYTILRNPALSGGVYRIPVRDLIGLHSRPMDVNEPWFPTAENDWVIMGDGTRAQVSLQTPDVVNLIEPGGAQKSYPTAEFLSASPRTLSPSYRLQAAFGIDYSHQAISTTKVPSIMHEQLFAGLCLVVAKEDIIKLTVEFKEAAASSLDYIVLVDLAASTASKHDELERAIAKILVDVCNEESWGIPFTQITLHQAS